MHGMVARGHLVAIGVVALITVAGLWIGRRFRDAQRGARQERRATSP